MHFWDFSLFYTSHNERDFPLEKLSNLRNDVANKAPVKQDDISIAAIYI